MTPAKFRIGRRRTMNHDLDTNDQFLNIGLGLGEVGELQNLIKKLIYHGHPAEQIIPKIIDEAGDTLFYFDWLFDLLGIEWSDVFTFNQKKLAARYPDGFSSERSINRSDGGVA